MQEFELVLRRAWQQGNVPFVTLPTVNIVLSPQLLQALSP